MSINPFDSFHSLRGTRTLTLFLLLTAPIPALAGNIYPMEGGDLRRENHSLNPSTLTNPLKVQWVTPPCDKLEYSISNAIVLTDRVVQAFRFGVRCYDRVTGARLWTWTCDRRTEIFNAPCYDADRNRIYVGTYTGDTLALDPQTGNVLWQVFHRPSNYPWQYSSPLYVGGKLYVGDGGTGFVCLNPDTQQVIWRFDIGAYLGTVYPFGTCTPAYDNGFIYLAMVYGDLFCLNASDGSVQWHIQENTTRINCPLLSDQYVYTLGEGSQVECRSRLDGSLVWRADTNVNGLGGATNGNLAICGDILVVPGDSWRVWGLNRFTGQKIWSTMTTGNFSVNAPFVVCGKIYISACHGDFYSMDGQTGQIEWRLFHGDGGTFIGWAEADGQLFAATSSGKMICFTSVIPGNATTCVCNLSATPVATPTPLPVCFPTPFITPIYLTNPNCTPTFTPTLTFTPTGTLTPSNTFTFTITPITTCIPANTLVFTPTLTATLTHTITPTPSGTWFTSTPTSTLTTTYSPTNTPTITSTPTGTWFTSTTTSTPTNTPTGTWLTSTPTGTPTNTLDLPTATPTNTPDHICHPVAYPNPSSGNPIHFNCGGGPYEEIDVNVYTTSFRKICQQKPQCHGLVEEDINWDLKDDHGTPVANGLYFVEIETHQKGLVKKYVQKCLILK